MTWLMDKRKKERKNERKATVVIRLRYLHTQVISQECKWQDHLCVSGDLALKRHSGTHYQIHNQRLLYTCFDLVFVCSINAQPGLNLSLLVLFLGHTKVKAKVSSLVTTTHTHYKTHHFS